jgi:hypothetical protein
LNAATSVTVRYFDPARGRRIASVAGNIDERFDIESTLRCDGQACRNALRVIPALLSTLRPRSEPCRDTNYVRIELRDDSDHRTRIYVDYSACVAMEGHYFTATRDFLWTFRNTRVAEW